MLDISVLQEEQRLLRQELNQLKDCQLRYFTLSVTGTAAIFGLVATLGKSAILGVAFLAPLSIILPCWCIFFDKATTITRIVGYYRVFERMIADLPTADTKYIGYERALALYRKEDDGKGRDEMDQYQIVQKTRDFYKQKATLSQKKIRHRYWMINWFTYTMLSTFCCILSLLSLTLSCSFRPWHILIPVFSFVLTLIFAWLTWKLMKQVAHGVYSYNENHCFWEFIHAKYGQRIINLEE